MHHYKNKQINYTQIGAHDAYNTGDKITYKGKKYTCKINNCVWTPDAYPQGWEEVL